MTPELLEVSKRRHNFGTKRFKEKSIFHARIALKSLILLFVRLIARGARIGKTDTQTHRQNKYYNPRACAPRVNNNNLCLVFLHEVSYSSCCTNVCWCDCDLCWCDCVICDREMCANVTV